MKKIAVALATVATVAVLSAPAAEARGGRNAAAIGFGLAAGALIAARLPQTPIIIMAVRPTAMAVYDPMLTAGRFMQSRFTGRGTTVPARITAITGTIRTRWI
jgi:hypothetical protein